MRFFRFSLVNKLGLIFAILFSIEIVLIKPLPESNLKIELSNLIMAAILAAGGFTILKIANFRKRQSEKDYISMSGFIRLIGILLFILAGAYLIKDIPLFFQIND